MNLSIRHDIILPSSSLRSIIHHYEWQEVGLHTDHRELPIYPNLATGFLFMFYQGDQVRVSNALVKDKKVPPTFLIPPTSIPTINYSFKSLKALRCLFCPGAMSLLFQFPMNIFQNGFIELSVEIDKELKFLHEEMAEKADTHRCIALFEAYIRKRLNVSSSPNIFSASQRILKHKPQGVTVQQLAGDLGLSRRQLNRLTQKQVGFSAKQFLQIHRFNRIIEYIHQADQVSLAQTAYQFGYFDQAHFSHDFKTLTNLSPKAYLKSIQKKDFIDLEEDYFYSGITGYKHR